MKLFENNLLLQFRDLEGISKGKVLAIFPAQQQTCASCCFLMTSGDKAMKHLSTLKVYYLNTTWQHNTHWGFFFLSLQTNRFHNHLSLMHHKLNLHSYDGLYLMGFPGCPVSRYFIFSWENGSVNLVMQTTII